jgi:hypothetical protein
LTKVAALTLPARTSAIAIATMAALGRLKMRMTDLPAARACARDACGEEL